MSAEGERTITATLSHDSVAPALDGSTAVALVLPTHDVVLLDVQQQAAAVLRDAQALVVAADTLVATGEYLARVATLLRTAEERRTELVKPNNDHVRAVNKLFREVLAPVVSADGLLRSKLKEYNREVDRARARAAAEAERQRLAADALADEAARAEAEGKPAVAAQLWEQAVASETAAEVATASVPAEAPPRTIHTEAGSVSTRTGWVHRIIDALAVPREYLVVDEDQVRAAIAAGVRNPAIPGIDIFEDQQIVVRR